MNPPSEPVTFIRPRSSDHGYCSTPSTAQTIHVCGGALRQGSVAISCDEYRSLQRTYGFVADHSPFFQAGADVSMLRYAEVDGIRIVAWLARVMRGTAPGADPLKAVVQLAIDAGWDVDPADVSWAKNDEPSEESS